MAESERPKVFISYSWTSPSYEEEVIELAKALMADGIDVVLDKWDLKEGQDKFAFMEKTVHDPTIKRVLVLCDKKYSEKADNRAGGVGTESQIISPKIYADVGQTKFIPIVMERDSDGSACLPTYLAGRIYFDYSSKDPKEYDRLVRSLWDSPLVEKPAIGPKPTFLKQPPDQADNLAGLLREQHRGTDLRLGKILPELSQRAAELIINPPNEKLTESIEAALNKERRLRPLVRDLLLAVLRSSRPIAQKREIFADVLASLHSAREPKAGTHYTHGHDVLYYLLRNVYLETVASLLQEKEYDLIALVISTEFVASGHQERLERYPEFGVPVPMIDEHLAKSRSSNKITLSTDLFLEHPVDGSPTREALLDADLVLFAQSCLLGGYHWVPYLTLYRERHSPTKFFLRLSSASAADTVKVLFGLSSFDELRKRVLAWAKDLRGEIVPRAHFGSPTLTLLNMGNGG